MASKQTRRSISVRGTTYAHLRDFCAQHERSMSDVVEELLSRILEDGERKPRAKTVAPLLARAVKPEPQVVVKAAVKPEPKPVPDRAAFRVSPLPAPEPARVAPVRPVAVQPAPARPVPVASAGRPAPTPATKVEGTQRPKSAAGDYRAIRF